MPDSTDLRALAEAATPRPWTVDRDPASGEMADLLDWPNDPRVPFWIDGPAFVDREDYGNYFTEADAAYIVAACNALPALLDERDRLREALAHFSDTPIELLAEAMCEGPTNPIPWVLRTEAEKAGSGYRAAAAKLQALAALTSTDKEPQR